MAEQPTAPRPVSEADARRFARGCASILVMGPIGSGKTRILRELERRPPGGRRPLYVPIPTLDFEGLATWCVEALGRPTAQRAAAALRAEIADLPEGLLLLIDDADRLPEQTGVRLGRLVAECGGRLAIVAVACGTRPAVGLAERLRAEHQMILDADSGALVRLGELHDLVETGRARARPARVSPETARTRRAPAPGPASPAPDVPAIEAASDADTAPAGASAPVRSPLAGPESAAPRAAPPDAVAPAPIPAGNAAPPDRWRTLRRAAAAPAARHGAVAIGVVLIVLASFELGRRSGPGAEVPPAPRPVPAIATPEPEAMLPPGSAPASPARVPPADSEAASRAPAAPVELPRSPTGAAPADEAPHPPAPPPRDANPVPSASAASAQTAGIPRTPSVASAPVVPQADPPPAATPLRLAALLPSRPAGPAPAHRWGRIEVSALLDPSGESRAPVSGPAAGPDPVVAAVGVPGEPDYEIAPLPDASGRAGESWLEVRMERGRVRAQVWLDGENVGRTPTTRFSVAPGPHRITVRLPSGRRIKHAFALGADRGARLLVRVVPTRNPVRLGGDAEAGEAPGAR